MGLRPMNIEYADGSKYILYFKSESEWSELINLSTMKFGTTKFLLGYKFINYAKDRFTPMLIQYKGGKKFVIQEISSSGWKVVSNYETKKMSTLRVMKDYTFLGFVKD